MKFGIAALAATLATGSPTAGGYAPPVVETRPTFVQPVPVPVSDWTRFYAGVQYGQGNADAPSDFGSGDSDFAAHGVHAGYNRDFGTSVLWGRVGLQQDRRRRSGRQG